MKTNNFYIFANVHVCVNKGLKFLSTTNSTTIKTVDSFPVSAVEDDKFLTIQHAVINGVENFNHYYSSYSCSKKVPDITTNTKIIKCTDCKVTQLLAKCPTKYSAKLIVSADNQAKPYLSIFNNCLSSLLPTTFTSHTTSTTLASYHTDEDSLCSFLSLPHLPITCNKYPRVVTTAIKEDNNQDSLQTIIFSECLLINCNPTVMLLLYSNDMYVYQHTYLLSTNMSSPPFLNTLLTSPLPPLLTQIPFTLLISTFLV